MSYLLEMGALAWVATVWVERGREAGEKSLTMIGLVCRRTVSRWGTGFEF